MNSSTSLPKQDDKNSFKVGSPSATTLPKQDGKSPFKPVSPFDLYYQLTYMSAMAASGISRSKTFLIAAQSSSTAAIYFDAINTLVEEFRFDYPEACRKIGLKAKSDNMKSFLLRFSDALRSGELLADFLAREAEVQGEDYQNKYERDMETLKQWSNAFSSMVISVALIVIIQMVTAMIYSMNVNVIGGMVGTGFLMACLGAWIIYRSAPREIMTVSLGKGSPEQIRALRLSRLIIPLAVAGATALAFAGVPLGLVLIGVSACLLPIGIVSTASDKKTNKKDVEFSTFLRSAGGMATSSRTTLKQALTKMDTSSFPTLEPDIERLSTRLQALVDPSVCWHKFGTESGSKLISEVIDIFYGAITIGGDPERVGYLCSLFTAKTAQLRARRRLTSGTFAGLTTVMQAVVAGLMVFVLSIVTSFATMVPKLIAPGDAMSQAPSMSMGLANFSPSDLQFLSNVTIFMILALALVSATAIILCDGGYKPKVALYLALTVLISGICMLVVPSLVAGILKV